MIAEFFQMPLLHQKVSYQVRYVRTEVSWYSFHYSNPGIKYQEVKEFHMLARTDVIVKLWFSVLSTLK